MKLRNVAIKKYKSFEATQNFEIENDITILVGMNESGKTAALEVIAKTKYFQDDESFQFNMTHDYPRREKKRVDKSNITPEAIVCTYEIGTKLSSQIADDLGEGTVTDTIFHVTTNYDNKKEYSGIKINREKFVENITTKNEISSKALNDRLVKVECKEDLDRLKGEYSDEKYTTFLATLDKYYENKWGLENDVISEYVTRIYLAPNEPKFLYYDEYFALPSRISIEKLNQGKLEESELKTAKALFELADINTAKIVKSEDFENVIAELEATEAIISQELLKYWRTNGNLHIAFQIDKIERTDSRDYTQIVEHILDIRVKNKGVSLPLKNRSKGFNWFFSFLVWFQRIQEAEDSNYILLLDEPGLNLHASAQADLLRFIEDLSKDYQIIYSTHSPFMIPSESLNRIRTVLETDNGSIVSDSIQEKDPNTLFPLQAALGYDIAQNLFISKKNLLVEGVSDLIILTAISEILKAAGREGLRDTITIVPTGGLEKVATFISLLRGSELEIVCLLDSYNDPKSKSKMDTMITGKIIHKNKIRFFNEFLDNYTKADIEDLFCREDYLKLFNVAFSDISDISESELDASIEQITMQINKCLGQDRFNHYLPAQALVKIEDINAFLSAETLDNFEKVYKEMNELFTANK